MVDADTFIASIIKHSDPNYDPVKAHEYYIRKRVLEGNEAIRNAHAKKGKKGSKSNAASTRLNAQKKAALQGAASSHAQAVAQLRATGERRQAEIKAKLQAAMERITKQSDADRANLVKQTDSKIANLPDMPNGLTRAQQAQWTEKRRKDIDKILGDAGLAKDKIGRGEKTNRETQSRANAAEKQKAVAAMRSSLDKARADYQAKTAAIRSGFSSKLAAISKQSDTGAVR